MGEQLKGEATAHLQDDSTFVLKPKNPYQMYIGNLNSEWKAFDDAHPRIITDNKNLTDGQEVDLYDYSKVEQILTKDGYRDLQWWEIKTFDEKKNRKQFALRTILRLRSEMGTSDSKLSPLSDEREKQHRIFNNMFDLYHSGDPLKDSHADMINKMIDAGFKIEFHPTSNQ